MRIQARRVSPAQRARKAAIRRLAAFAWNGLLLLLQVALTLGTIVVLWGFAAAFEAKAATTTAIEAVVVDVAPATMLPEQRVSPYGAPAPSRAGTMIGAALGGLVAMAGQNGNTASYKRYAVAAAAATVGGVIGDLYDRRHPAAGATPKGFQVILDTPQGKRAIFCPWQPAKGQKVWLVGDDQIIPAS
jgi:hypothetical protein